VPMWRRWLSTTTSRSSRCRVWICVASGENRDGHCWRCLASFSLSNASLLQLPFTWFGCSGETLDLGLLDRIVVTLSVPFSLLGGHRFRTRDA
jgi:hypothetical protein